MKRGREDTPDEVDPKRQKTNFQELLKLIQDGDEVSAGELIAHMDRQELNQVDKYGRTVLHYAAAEGYKEICELIIEKHPEAINAINNDGYTALHLAAEGGNKEVCELIIGKYPETINAGITREDDTSGKTALHLAAEGGHKEIFELILNVNPEAIESNTTGYFGGKTVLHFAAAKGRKEICELILNIKPDIIDVIDENEGTALHEAAQGGYKEICELVLDRSPEAINASYKSFSVLHAAALGGHKKACDLVITKINSGAINAITAGGHTILHCAVLGGNEEVCEMILKMNPQAIYATDNDDCGNNTALHFAALKYNKKMWEMLIDNMHVQKIVESLCRGSNKSNSDKPSIQNMLSKIIADFISEKFASNEYPIDLNNYYQVKLLKLYQVLDQESLLGYSSNTLAEENSNLYVSRVNNYITKHYFKLIGVCKSINADSLIAILTLSDDCMSNVLSYLSPSLYAEHFDAMACLVGVDSELTADDTSM